MNVKRGVGLVAALVLMCGAAVASTAGSVVATSGKDQWGDGDPATRRVVESLADEKLDATVQMIQDAGIDESNPDYAGTVLVDASTPGRIDLRYLESSPFAEELLRTVADLNESAPMPIVPVPTSVDIGALEELALRLSDDDVALEYGIDNVTGVSFDMITGRVILMTSNLAQVDALRVSSTTPHILVDGVIVEVMYEDSSFEEGFQADRADDHPSWVECNSSPQVLGDDKS